MLIRKRRLNVLSLVKPNVRKLVPYEAKEIPCLVKLDANESPYPFEIKAKTLKNICSNRYPDPEAKELRETYARSLGLKGREWLLHGNGSDEIIYYLVATFGGPVLCPVPTFSMYANITRGLGEKIIQVPLDFDFDLDLKKMLAVIREQRPKLLFLASPNNPTGNLLCQKKIMSLIKESGGMVVVDEAYQPFSGNESFISLLDRFENLLVMRTLSKIGLAGLRAGFLAGRPETLNEVNRVRLPFNMNSLSQAVAVDSLKEERKLKKAIKAIISERNRLFKEMSGIRNIAPFPSDANFILFRVRGADEVYKRLLEKGVLIRNLHPAIKDCLRVTAGTPKENDLFLKTLGSIMRTR